jgi:N-acetylneuraminic acid mutarotase
MKLILTVFIVFSILFSAIPTVHAQYVWAATETIPAPGRHHASVFALGDYIYLLCGTNSDESQQFRDMWKFIPPENRWLQMRDFPGNPRSYAATFVINGKGYITVGINDSGTLTDLWEYSPDDDSWTQKADFPGEGRAHPAYFTLNDEGYVGCGDGQSGDYKDFYKYSPTTNTWKSVRDFMGPANHHPAFFTINNKAYICTGHDRSGNQVLNTNYEYNPVTDSWKQKANLPAKGRVGAIGFAINNLGFIGGGFDEVGTGEFYRDFYVYNPTTDLWNASVPPFPDINGTFAAVSAVMGNVAYAGTGMDSMYVSQNTWYSFRDESVGVEEQTTEQAAKLISGRGYIRFESVNPSSSLTILNQLGQTMFSSPQSKGNSMIIPTIGWASGIYLARYMEGTTTKKISFIVAE